MRLLVTMVLCASPTASFAQGSCPAAEPVEPFMELDKGLPVVALEFDREWFKCARKEGELEVEFVGHAGGQTRAMRVSKVRSAKSSHRLARNHLCDGKFFPDKVSARLRGTGAFASMSQELAAQPVSCPRCQYRSYNTMVAAVPWWSKGGGKSRRPAFELRTSFDKDWLACAKKHKGTLEAHFYVGASKQDVMAALKPTLVIKGLEHDSKRSLDVPKKKVCTNKDAKVLAWELVGTGEMEAVQGIGRGTVELNCEHNRY